jgi:hypothetical protein
VRSNGLLIALLTICLLSHEVPCRPQAGISARALAAAATILATSRGGGVFFAFFLVIVDCHKKKTEIGNTPPPRVVVAESAIRNHNALPNRAGYDQTAVTYVCKWRSVLSEFVNAAAC